MLIFNKYSYKNKKSKLHFGDRGAALNDFFTKLEGVLAMSIHQHESIEKGNEYC
jgi:hypothetical protein